MKSPAQPDAWAGELAFVDSLMRELSRETEPQALVRYFRESIDRYFPCDRWLTLSRRSVFYPRYLVTRCSDWQTSIDPWLEPHKLPLLHGGLLADALYSDAGPQIIDDPEIAGDPAEDLLKGMRRLVTIPLYDHGQPINMAVGLWRDPAASDLSRLPLMLWQSNLFGRSVHNLLLRSQLSAINRVLEDEFRVVGSVQHKLLPAHPPATRGIELATHYQTARRAGGDYFDWFELDANRLGLIIADVSGHGAPAAVGMAITRTLAHVAPRDLWLEPDRLLARLNEQIYSQYTAGDGAFVTAVAAFVEVRKRTLRYASAGHPAPVARSGDRTLALRDVSALPLGVLSNEDYQSTEVRLADGDSITFYTDGIVEAHRDRGELFGTDRLLQTIAAAPESPRAMIDAVVSAVADHLGQSALSDDCTLVTLRLT
jgi:phosphoserine phosphatase RsbU/P